MLSQYNFIIENKLIEFKASNLKEGRKQAELTVKELKSIPPEN